jgi:hypothetical protein
LWLNEQQPIAGRPDGSRHTTGLRWAGTRPISNYCDAPARIWSWDVEGAYQFGHDNGNTVSAAFFSANMAHQWKQAPWQPKLTSLFYWGSGDHDPTDGQDNTFNTLFPLGHAYWGFIDNLTGQNLADYSMQLSVAPTKKLTMLGAWHWFFLDRNTDVLYNVAGAPIGTANTGTDVGEEFDLVATYAVNANFNIQVGYLWFFNGGFVDANAPRDDATQLYVQTLFRY